MGNELDVDNVLDKKIEQRVNSRSHTFYYLVGSAPDKSGRMKSFLLGPYSDYEKATQIAESKRLSSYTVENFSSSDLSRVGQILKARRLHSGASMADIFERVKHKSVGEDTI
jgi:hypothetical protein